MTQFMHIRRSLRRGRWPVFLFVLIMLAATAYAFSPRPLPSFPPTRVHADDLLVTGVARQNARIVAVGELGQILWADSAAGPWHKATVQDGAHGETFTQIHFVAPGVAVAVGHGAIIERSSDGGKSWKQVSYQPRLNDALLGFAGPFHGKLIAYGSFGLMETSADGGKTWTKIAFNITPLPKPAPAATAAGADSDNPFADYTPVEDPSTHHIYGITQLSDGQLLLVGERGLIALSQDNGSSWTQQPKVYEGSFFGVLKPSAGTVLIYGLGGHVYVSRDGAKTWTASKLPVPVSTFGGAVLADGRVVLVGAQETVLVSSDGGRAFKLLSQADRGSMAAVLALAKGKLLAAGVLGVHDEDIAAVGAAATAGAGS